jgi:hypothetical protein
MASKRLKNELSSSRLAKRPRLKVMSEYLPMFNQRVLAFPEAVILFLDSGLNHQDQNS